MHAARLMPGGFEGAFKHGWCVTWLLLFLGLLTCRPDAKAQSTILFEGFEGIFPNDNGWSVGDANGAGVTAFWDDVNSSFGGEGTHSGSWKGYCAGFGFSGSTAVPFYRDFMSAFMNRSVNLAGYANAKVQFWFKVPSIELNFDFCRVRVDGAQVWVTNLPVANWSQANVSLNAYVGGAHTLSFEFTSDGSVTNEGWYLDDIRVLAASLPVAEYLDQFAHTNYTGYVIDSDASNPSAAYNRESLLVSSVVRAENFLTSPTNHSYYLSYRLLNAGTGLPHPLFDSTGVTNANYTHNLTNGFPMAALESVSRTNLASLKPAARLDPYAQYTIEMKLYRGATYMGITATDGPRTYYHFTNLVSSDPALNVIATLNSATLVRTAAVQTVATKKSFTVDTSYTLRRYDSFTNTSPVSSNVTVSLNYELRNAATEAVIPTTASSSNIVRAIFSFTPGSTNPVTPRELSFNDTLQIEPAIQLDSVSNTYKVVVTIAHVDTAGQPAVTGNTQTTTTSRLLHFNGKLFFGPIETTFTSIANDPPTVSVTPTFVRSELAVNNNSGVITGNPGYTYGSGAVLAVLLRPNGNAELTSGSVLVNAPIAPDADEVANVRFERGPITLDTTGAHADVTVTLPTGFGYRLDTASRILLSTFGFNNVSLAQMLDPGSDLTYGGLFYAVEETKPLWIQCNTLTWQINQGQFVLGLNGIASYVRGDELVMLETAPGLVEPDMTFKRSNEQYFRQTFVTSPQATLAAHTDGSARMTLNLGFNPGEFRAHFPYDTFVKWTSTGAMTITGDQVTPAGSQLNNADPVELGYNTDCLDLSCPPMNGVENLQLSVTNGMLHFTLDGGLQAAGTLAGSPDLNWGYIGVIPDFAQRTDPFTYANFHMSGCWLRGDQTGLADNDGPGVILNTGVQPGNLASTERPGTSGYLDGFADYPGFNFRVMGDGLKDAVSVLAGVSSGHYPLTGRSKYYTRWAGVSGIHEAVFGSFPTNATLYGYEVNFSNYGLSYLDSENHESRTEGFVHIGGPSNFDQDFKELMFDCLGALTSAKVPAGQTNLYKSLQYWNADFVAQAIKFDRADGVACDPGVGYFVLGVKAHATHVNQPLFGELGFRDNGNLITAEDISSATIMLDPPFDSRLKGPNNFKLKGPASEQYDVTLIADAYLNNYEHYVQPPPAGFMNLIVKLDVPFFEDLKGHIHTTARTNDPTGPIYLMGGWGTPNKGFSDGGNHFFNTTGFDDDNVGYPKAGLFSNPVTVSIYRNNPDMEEDRYRVRAQRTWLGVVPFDYPLDWSSTTRSFKSHKEVEDDLLVIHVKHQCKYLSAENAELSFGAQFSALPQLNLVNMAFNALDEATGVFSAVTNAIGDVAGEAINLGLQELNKPLSDLSHKFFEQPFDELMTPVVNNLYAALATKFNAATKQWDAGEPAATIQDYFTDPGANTVLQKFKDLMGASPALPGALKELDQTLLDVTNALAHIRTVLAESPLDSGHRELVKNLVTELVGELAAAFASALAEDKVNELLANADPTLDQVDAAMAQLMTVIGQVRAGLQAGGQLNEELNDLFNSAGAIAQINSFVTQARTDVTTYFNNINVAVDNPFQDFDEQEVKDFIRQKLEDRFFGSALSASVQTIFRQRLYDLNAAVREGVDSVFQQVNTTIRDVISETLAEVSNEFTPGLGDLDSVFGAARIDGYAHINNDSLKLLRLDILAKLNFSSEMEFKAFLQIKELDSEGTPTECLPASGKATEVTCGATGSGLDWISPDLTASVGAKFTFDTSSGLNLVNLGGSFEITGELEFEGFAIKELGLAMAVGELENYLAAKLRVEFNKKEFAGGVFFGKTCSLDPLKLADPNVADVIGAPPFTGFYIYGEAWYPINELIGIPTTCFFNVVGGAGVGTFFFAEGPTFGGRIHYGLSGEVLCIVEIKGEVDLIGVKKGDDYTFKGTGKVSGELGVCPFCVDFSKSVSMTCKVHLQLGGDASVSWDIDL